MSGEKMSVKQVAEVISGEGLGYSVQHFIDPGSIADETLSKLWAEAEEILAAIEGFFTETLGDDWEDNFGEEDEEDDAEDSGEM